MRGQRVDDELTAFVHARTAELHRTAYLLTADQDRAERLVQHAVDELRRDRTPLGQAGTTARDHMARLAARVTEASGTPNDHRDPLMAAIAGLTPRQRAVLMLRTLDRYDERATAKSLGIPKKSVASAESEASNALGIPTDSDRCRTALTDFADHAGWPAPGVTLADTARAAVARRRPWWTYVAGLVVVALTITCVVVTQQWHKDWLRTPEGLNHSHGTHFPTYTEGYQLVTVRDMIPGIAQDVTTGAAGAVALPCDAVDPTVRLSVQSDRTAGSEGDSCPDSTTRARLTRVKGRASAMVLGGTRHEYPVGVYRKVPLSEYPIATTGFEIQHSLTLSDVRKETPALGRQSLPSSRGPVLTLHGTTEHHNGVFRGSLRLPQTQDGIDAPQIRAVGLLSPTTTGRFQVRIDGRPPMTDCGERRPVSFYSPYDITECSLVDRRVPQVKYLQDAVVRPGSTSVEITVSGTRGPWTLQVAADGYVIGGGSAD